MQPESQGAASSSKLFWAGCVVSALPTLMLVFSAVMKFVQPEGMADQFAHLGYSMDLAVPLGIVELACTLIYVIPRTSGLGAILLTGYLGGAVATHVRLGEAFFIPIVLGVLVWGGLYLRDARLRALVPLRS